MCKRIYSTLEICGEVYPSECIYSTLYNGWSTAQVMYLVLFSV